MCCVRVSLGLFFFRGRMSFLRRVILSLKLRLLIEYMNKH